MVFYLWGVATETLGQKDTLTIDLFYFTDGWRFISCGVSSLFEIVRIIGYGLWVLESEIILSTFWGWFCTA